MAVLACAGVKAQEARDCFVEMPDSLCTLLTAVNRADFIDFLDSNMKARVENTFRGRSEMTELSPDYIHVQLTSQSTWQMKLLPVNDSTKVICVVNTVCAPACDSRIDFYTTDWHKLPSDDYLPELPAVDDFILPYPDTADIYVYQEAVRQADLPLFKAGFSKEGTELTFVFSAADYVEPDIVEKLESYLRPAVIYAWEDGRFCKQ